MGCVSSVFQFGSYLVQEGAEANEDAKEESILEKDGVPAPSSPSQDTVTVGSSRDKVQESPTKIEAPLAKEEESFTQQASPAPKEETKKRDEPKAEEVEAPEPEVKELQRVNETKLEKEKTVDTSGVTTEKTVYTQVSESLRIQETKGPAVDPFSSSQKTVFPPFSKTWHESKPQTTESQTSPSYVHSVKVTENSSPSSPVSVSSGAATPEKTTVHQFSSSAPEKVSEKAEVVEVATDAAQSLNFSQAAEPELEKFEVKSPAPPAEEQQATVEQDSSEVEVVQEEQVIDDNERTDVEGAVVKIQAGIRGYLTRKSLKESRKDGPLQTSKGGASVQSPSKQEAVPAEEPLVLSTEEMQTVTDTLVEELGEADAAVKIQAMYRGYRTRKQLDELLNEPYEQEIETLNLSAEQTESTAQESRRSPPDRSPVIVTENFVPILKAQVTITPPSSPTIKKDRSTIPSSPEVAVEDSKASSIPDKFGDTDETSKAVVSDDNEDEEMKKEAATKIQAAFRGFKVRKISKKETAGSAKEISEEAKENVERETEDDTNQENIPQMRDTPSPPLEPENDEDTLEDNAEEGDDDDDEDIPNVQWQTSELYTDDLSPKHVHEHDESKTESFTEEATVPVSDTPKTTHTSSEQILISTAKISLGSPGSAAPKEGEEQRMESDH